MPREARSKTVIITDQRAVALPVREGRYTVWDSKISGFGVRVAPTGTKTYVFTYRAPDGTQRRPTIGRVGVVAAVDARKKALSLAAAVANGEDPTAYHRPEDPSVLTVAALCDGYVDYLRGSGAPSTVRQYEGMLRRNLYPSHGRMPAVDLRPKHLEDIRRRPEVTDSVFRQLVKIVSAVYKRAIMEGQVKVDPCAKTKVTKLPPRERRLTESEIRAIKAGIDAGVVAEGAGRVIWLLLLTGARSGEILRMRWQELDLGAGLLMLKTSKTGPKMIKLNSAAVELLRAIEPTEGNPYVFASRSASGHLTSVVKPFEVLCRKAGVTGASPHSLRKTFASMAAADNVPLGVVARLLGHESQSTTEKYYAFAGCGEVANAAEGIGHRLAEIIGTQ